MKNNTMKLIAIIVFLSAFMGNLFAQSDGKLTVTELTASISTAAATPVDYINDRNSATGWQLSGQETYGWAILQFGQKNLVYGIEIEASLAENSSLQLKYRQGDGWIPFAGMVMNGAAELNEFIDLSFQNCVTDELMIVVNGADASMTRINEVTIFGKPAETVYHRINPVALDASDNTLFPHYDTNLIDGNLMSQWKVGGSNELNPEIQAIIENYLGISHAYHPSLDAMTGDVEGQFNGNVLLEKIKFFIIQSGFELLTLELKTGSQWQTVAELNGTTGSGWHTIDVPSTIGEAAAFRVTMHCQNTDQTGAGLGEIEFWGRKAYSGDVFADIGPKVIDTVSLPFNTTFTYNEKDQPSLVFVTDNFGGPLVVEINHAEHEINGSLQLNGNTVFIYTPDEDELYYGNNFFRVRSGSSPFTLKQVLLRNRNSDGLIRISSTGLTDGLKFTSNGLNMQEQIIDLGGTRAVDKIRTFSKADAFVEVSYCMNDVWQVLPVEEYGWNSMDFICGTEIQKLKLVSYESIMPDEIILWGSGTLDKTPEITVISPDNRDKLIGTSGSGLFIVGMVDVPSVNVTINGIQASQSDIYFWLPVSSLQLASGELSEAVIRAVDVKGRVGEKSITLMNPYFYIPLIIDQKEDVYYVSGNSFTFSGRVTSDDYDLYVADELIMSGQGSFTKTVELAEGFNLFEFVLKKSSTGETKYRVLKRVVSVYPEIRLSVDAPQDDSYTNKQTVTVSGRVDGGTGATVKVNNVPATVASGFWQSVVTLNEGVNTIVVTAGNDQGQTKTIRRNITLDTVAPVIANVLPLDGSYSASSDVSVSATITDSSPYHALANEQAGAVSGSSFQCTMSFGDGVHDILIVATDAAGNTGLMTFQIMVDTVAPDEFTVTANPAVWTNNNQPQISFVTSDEPSGIDHYEIRIDAGGFVTAASPYTVPPQEDGEHQIAVKAIDRAGNETTAVTTIYIDTTPPVVPQTFRAVPADDRTILKWEESDNDIVEYHVTRTPAWETNELIIPAEAGTEVEEIESVLFEYNDDAVKNGTVYEYTIMAIDHASNASEISLRSCEAGIARADYSTTEATFVEYENMKLVMKSDTLPEEVKKIEVQANEDQTLVDAADFPVIGPVYSLSVVVEKDGVLEKQEHINFEKPYVGTLSYNKEDLPFEFPEQNLSVYYFDRMWGKWLRIKDSYVDPEKNTILFATNHFSDLTVQPTLIEDLSPQELADSGYSPVKTYNLHGEVVVSPQGGGASTQVTDIVLPGRNGFNFALKRIYDSATARSDASGVNLTGSFGLNFNKGGLGDSLKELGEVISFAGQLVDSLFNLQSKIFGFLQGQGDYAYKIGDGWRLSIPYIINTGSDVSVRLPDGGIYSMTSMDVQDVAGNVNYMFYRRLTMANHNGQDFSLKVTQINPMVDMNTIFRDLSDIFNLDFDPFIRDRIANTLKTDAWYGVEYKLIMKDGTTYDMDFMGRTTKITDPTGLNVVNIKYNNFQIDYIDYEGDNEDGVIKNKLKFTYSTNSLNFYQPRIKSIRIEDDPYNRNVQYNIVQKPYLFNNPSFAGIPDWCVEVFGPYDAVFVLGSVTDAKNRVTNYTYKPVSIVTGTLGGKINFVSAILDAISYIPGVDIVAGIIKAIWGFDTLTIYGHLKSEVVFALETLTAPGIGYNKISYELYDISHIEFKWTDYFNVVFLEFPTGASLEYDWDARLMTSGVETRLSAGSSIINNTTYEYDYKQYFDNVVDENGLHAVNQMYNEKTVVRNGRTKTIYYYDTAVTVSKAYPDLMSWISDLLSNLQNIVRFDSEKGWGISFDGLGTMLSSQTYFYNVVTFNNKKEVFDLSNNNLIETEYITWDKDTSRMLSSKRQFSATNYTLTQFSYDNWGNVTRQRNYAQTGTRTNESESWMYYHNTNSTKQSSVPWRSDNPYTAPPSVNSFNHSLLLGQVTKNVIPPEAGTVSPVYSHTYYAYNSYGLQTGVAVWTGSEWAKKSMSYYVNSGNNEHGEIKNVITEIDADRDHETLFEYDYTSSDDYYFVTKTEKAVESILTEDGQPADVVTITAFEKCSDWKAWERDPRSYVTGYKYDALGRTTDINEPLDSDDLSADPKTGYTWRADHPVTHIEYNDTDIWSRVTNPKGAVVTFDYNTRGQLVEINKQNRTFDADNNPVTENAVTKLAYNAWGEIIAVTDPRNNTTNYEYDATGRKKSIILPPYNNVRATKTFDFNYDTNLQTIIDEEGNKTEELYDQQGRVIRQTQYLESGDMIVTSVYYDGTGNEVVTIDPKGNKVVNVYDGRNLLTRTILSEDEFFENGQKETLSPVKKYNYNKASVMIAEIIETATGDHETTYIPDSLGRTYIVKNYYTDPSDAFNPNKEVVQRIYFDVAGNKVRIVDPNNYVLPEAEQKFTSYTYSVKNKLLTETDQAGNTTSYVYDVLGNKISETDPRGTSGNYTGDFTVLYHYDDLNRLIKAELPVSDDIMEKPVIRFVYDLRGNVLQRIQPDGGKISYTYNSRNWTLTETQLGNKNDDTPVSLTNTFIYDQIGNIRFTKDNVGNVTETQFDALNRVVKVIHPLGNFEQNEYDKNGNQTAVIDGLGRRVEMEYNAHNMMKRTINPENNVSEIFYDRLGNKTKTTDVKNRSYTYTYDELNRMLTETDPMGNVAAIRYDLAGNVISRIDPNQTVSEFEYYDNYLIENVHYSNPNTNQTRDVAFRYDEAGNTVWQNDNGVITEYNMDLTADIDSSYKQDHYLPDPYGRIIRKTTYIDGKRYTIAYDFDALGRLTEIIYPDSYQLKYVNNNMNQLETVPGYIDTPILYNLNNLPEKIQAINGISTAYSYDNNSRLMDMTYENAGIELKKYTFTYDNANNIRTRNENNYTYDAMNRLTFASLNGKFEENVTNQAQKAGFVADDQLGENAVSFAVPDMEISFDYASTSFGIDLQGVYSINRIELMPANRNHRLHEKSLAVLYSQDNTPGSYNLIDDWTYEQDEDGHVMIRLATTAEARYLKIHCYFDERDVSKNAVDASTVQQVPAELIKVFYLRNRRYENYAYDEIGNRTSSSYRLDNLAPKIKTYSYYPNSDRLMADGEFGYVYDANGNLTEKSNGYNIEDEKVIFEIAEGLYWRYEYDLLNRLVAVYKSESGKDNAVLAASYTYDAEGLRVKKSSVANGDTYFVYGTDGKVLREETADKYTRYIYIFGKHFAKTEGSIDGTETNTYFYGLDHLGSSIFITDASGKMIWQDEATPFGERSGEIGDKHHDLIYTGKGFDEDTGLYYFNARWYDAEMGRFTSVDPIRDSVNWYVYCSNNPLMFIDPEGLEQYASLDEWKEGRRSKAKAKALQMQKNIQAEFDKNSVDLTYTRHDTISDQEIYVYGNIQEAVHEQIRLLTIENDAILKKLNSGQKFTEGDRQQLEIFQNEMDALEDFSYAILPEKMQKFQAGKAQSMLLEFVPGLGTLKRFYDVAVGQELFSGYKFTVGERVGKGIFLAIEVAGITKSIKNKFSSTKTQGPDITYSTKQGKYPSWSTVKKRYWKLQDIGTVPRGNAKVMIRKTGEIKTIPVSKELHHINGRTGADPHRFSNLQEFWPWEHEIADPFRNTGYDFIEWVK